MKKISSNSLKEIYNHVICQYPSEACGFVFNNGSVYIATNIQNELHQKNPIIYPRKSTEAYSMSPLDIKMLNNSFKTDNYATFIYHSHPDVGAYFSDEDTEKALFMNKPIYDVDHLVIDIKKGKIMETKQFSFIENSFTCIAIYDSNGFVINSLKT